MHNSALIVQVWRRQQAAAPTAFPARAGKSIAAIEELVAGFPLHNPQDERLQDLMDELRAKFKVRRCMLALVAVTRGEVSAACWSACSWLKSPCAACSLLACDKQSSVPSAPRQQWGSKFQFECVPAWAGKVATGMHVGHSCSCWKKDK